MNSKAKISISLAILASVGCVSGVSYAAFNMNGTTSQILPITVSKINIEKAPISFAMSDVSHLSVTNKYDFIVNDKLSIKFSFDDNAYDASRNNLFDYAYGGMLFTFNIANQNLYNHLKNVFVVKKDNFNVTSDPSNITFSNNVEYKYKKQNAFLPCFTSDDHTKQIRIMLPISSDTASLNTHCIRYIDPNGRVNNIWNFTCRFDFSLIKQGEEMSQEFKGSDLTGSYLNISLENLK